MPCSKWRPIVATVLSSFVSCAAAATSVAAAQSVAPDLLTLPWAQLLVGGVISIWGGLTRCAQRLLPLAAMHTRVQVTREVIATTITAAGSGFIVFLFGLQLQQDEIKLALMLWVGGYTGTRLLERLADGWMDRIAERFPVLFKAPGPAAAPRPDAANSEFPPSPPKDPSP